MKKLFLTNCSVRMTSDLERALGPSALRNPSPRDLEQLDWPTAPSPSKQRDLVTPLLALTLTIVAVERLVSTLKDRKYRAHLDEKKGILDLNPVDEETSPERIREFLMLLLKQKGRQNQKKRRGKKSGRR